MPSAAASCSDAKQMYINGHFCYADKFGILTKGLGVVREILFPDDDMCIAGKHTQNHLTTKADVFLAGIASQLTVIVAFRMNYPEYIRNLKLLAV